MKIADDGGENNLAARRSGDLDELLGEYFGELESQREHARTRFLKKHPRFRSELRSFFDDYDQLDAWTESLRARSEHIDLMGQMLGGYEIRRVVGYGAMGVVYEAWQAKLKRRVALKVLPQELLPRERLGERFEQEARVTAGLAHPSICPVYEFGQDKGYRFIAMQFVDGETLTDRIEWSSKAAHTCCVVSLGCSEEPRYNEGRLSRDDRGPKDVIGVVTLFVKLCHALHFIHEQDVVHRDIKPGNIMVRANGDPVIVDFGLARTEDIQASSLTETGAIVGTLSYMSPEQIQGKSAVIDQRTDVYSLGVTLFECLTLQKPFDGQTRHEVYQHILFSDPPDCRQINRHVPRDLKSIVEKAMEKEPQRRYASADEFADDLRSVLAHEPVKARAVGPLLRIRRWSRRHPAIATLQICLLASLLVSLCFIYALYRHQVELQRAHVKSLTIADSASFPQVLIELRNDGILAPLEPYLRASLRQHAEDSKEKLHLNLALSIFDDALLDDVFDRVPTTTPQEARAIAEVAKRYPPQFKEFKDRLERTVSTGGQLPAVRLRAFTIASRIDPSTDLFGWIPELTTWLHDEPRYLAEKWLDIFDGSVRAPLAEEFQTQLSDGRGDREQQFAQWALIGLKDYDVDFLVESLLDGKGLAHQKAIELLERGGAEAVAAIRKRFTGKFPGKATEDEKDRIASEQANLAAALLRIDPERAKDVWSLLKHSADPRLRTFLILRLATAGVAPMLVLSRLRGELDPSARYALVLALGEYSRASLSEEDRTRLVGELQRVFVEDPYPGVHGAALWTVGRLAGVQVATAMEQELATETAFDGKRWRYGANGHCMMEIDGSPDFVMGSPKTEQGRTEMEVQRRGVLPRRYLLSAREVSWAQFAPFYRRRHEEWKAEKAQEARTTPGHSYAKARMRFYSTFQPELDLEMVKCGDCPAAGKWYAAVFYCLWLSELEGMDKEEWCYEVREIVPGFFDWALKKDYLSKAGYRLPTAAEWEYACRANALTRRPYGNADELLSEYAWFREFRENSTLEVKPRAQLKPNDYGIFNLLGNIAEYCESDLHELDRALREREPEFYADRNLAHEHFFRRPHFYVEAHGGSFQTARNFVRSSYYEIVERSTSRPLGFRLARTVAR